MQPRCLPKWWKKMYSRSAKGILANVWSKLMAPTDWKEVLSTIRQADTEKAAGTDGITSDLLHMITEDVTNQPTAFLNILTEIINVAFDSGQSLPSWRKAIISMIPKKNEDGSYTKSIGE